MEHLAPYLEKELCRVVLEYAKLDWPYFVGDIIIGHRHYLTMDVSVVAYSLPIHEILILLDICYIKHNREFTKHLYDPIISRRWFIVCIKSGHIYEQIGVHWSRMYMNYTKLEHFPQQTRHKQDLTHFPLYEHRLIYGIRSSQSYLEIRTD